MTETAFDPQSVYVDLKPSGAEVIAVDARFWSDVKSGARVIAGRLVSAYRFDGDWASWERHPAGEELVVMLEGAMTLALETPEGERRMRVEQGEAFLIPKGFWHRGVDCAGAKALFVTEGEGTEHRPA